MTKVVIFIEERSVFTSFSNDIEVKTLLSSMNITTFVIVFTNYKNKDI